MFSLGGSELLLIAVIALVLFGPDKIPQMARSVGRLLREFNKYRDIMESTVRAEIYRTDRDEGKDVGDHQAGLDRITQAAKASQDLIAERAAAEEASAEASSSGEKDGPAATPPQPPTLLATDEDEEDGA